MGSFYEHSCYRHSFFLGKYPKEGFLEKLHEVHVSLQEMPASHFQSGGCGFHLLTMRGLPRLGSHQAEGNLSRPSNTVLEVRNSLPCKESGEEPSRKSKKQLGDSN